MDQLASFGYWVRCYRKALDLTQVALAQQVGCAVETVKKIEIHVFGALAEFERDQIRERTHAGLTAARARGKVGGRPRVLSPKKVTQLQALAADPIADILDTLNMRQHWLATWAIWDNHELRIRSRNNTSKEVRP